MAVWHPSVRIEFRSVYSLVFAVWEVSPFIADGCGVKGRLDSIQRFFEAYWPMPTPQPCKPKSRAGHDAEC